MQAFDLVVLAHMLAGGIAIAAVGSRAQWPEPGCVLAAALFMFGGAASDLHHGGSGFYWHPLVLQKLSPPIRTKLRQREKGFSLFLGCPKRLFPESPQMLESNSAPCTKRP